MIQLRPGHAVRLFAASALLAALAGCSSNSASTATTTPPASAFAGSYVFSATGTDSSDGDYAVLGSFVADASGNITSAVADYNLGSGVDNDVPLTGTYTVAGSTATITLTDGASVKDTFTAAVSASMPTQIQGFDGSGTGTLYHQATSGFSPAGTYSFSLQGEGDGVITGVGTAVATSAGTLGNGSLTFADGATLNTYSPVTGFIAAPEGGGRGQAALEGNNLAYYVVASNQIVLLGLDDQALLNLTATKQ